MSSRLKMMLTMMGTKKFMVSAVIEAFLFLSGISISLRAGQPFVTKVQN
jgi:hypothetical protein